MLDEADRRVQRPDQAEPIAQLGDRRHVRIRGQRRIRHAEWPGAALADSDRPFVLASSMLGLTTGGVATEDDGLGSQIPAGATVSRALHRITFSGSSVRLVVLASPSGSPDERFRIAGMVNPAIVVKGGARVSIEVINSDPDTAHGLVVTAGQAGSSRMPMTASPAFAGSAVWSLGNPASAGMHAGTLTFAASTPGTYRYVRPVPRLAQEGMTGTFIVATT